MSRSRRPPGAVPVERVRGAPPGAGDERDAGRGDWRADPRSRSRHSRLIDHVRTPADDPDPKRAAALCGALARAVLRDFAPALVLLGRAERQRGQALAAHAAALFDFAARRGIEGERLAEINAWEFQLEAALDGRPAGQPVFVRMAGEEATAPWDREGLDLLTEAARRRALGGRPETAAAAAAEAERIGRGLVSALLGERHPQGAGALVGALLRLRGLQDLGARLATRTTRLPREEIPDAWDPGRRTGAAEIAAAVAREARDLGGELAAGGRVVAELPRAWRAGARYALLAARRLLGEIEELGGEVVEEPPSLGLLTRLGLLARARLGGP